eukprot:gene3139-2121_t
MKANHQKLQNQHNKYITTQSFTTQHQLNSTTITTKLTTPAHTKANQKRVNQTEAINKLQTNHKLPHNAHHYTQTLQGHHK